MNEGAPIIIKKKKVSGHGHHGGAWKVAYADFVTAMMAFFLVMWIMGMADETRMNVQGYFQDPLGYTRTAPKGRLNLLPPGGRQSPQERLKSANASKEAQIDRQKLEKIEKDFSNELSKFTSSQDFSKIVNNVEWHFTDKGLEIEFIDSNSVTYFSLGSDQVTPAARQVITLLANILGKTSREFEVHGHTDAHQYPGAGYDNLDLSTDRALAVKRVLVAGGVRKTQVTNVEGWADKRLKYPSDPMNPRNRRVTLVIPYSTKSFSTGGTSPDLDLADSRNQIRASADAPRAPRISDFPSKTGINH